MYQTVTAHADCGSLLQAGGDERRIRYPIAALAARRSAALTSLANSWAILHAQ